MKNEVKVGIFVFMAMVFLFFLTTQVGSFKNFSKEGYTVVTDLSNAAGLEANSKVKANGIDVGYVKSMKIVGDKIRAELFINEGINIPDDSVLTPMAESMLGGKYAGISLGKSTSFLKPDSIISSGNELASIDQASDSMTRAADEFSSFIQDFRDVLDEKAKTNLKNTFANIDQITSDLREFTKLGKLNSAVENFNNMAESLSETSDKFSTTADMINNKLPKIMDNINTLITDLKIASLDIRVKVPALADKFSMIADDLNQILNENRSPLNDSLKSANSFFSTGEDTFAKVDSLLETVDKVQLEVAMRGEMMGEDGYAKGYLTLDYKPSDTKSYKFDIAGMEDYTNTTKEGSLIEPKKHEESKLLISAQIAKRFEDITLRGGLIESTFGAGVDYYMFNDKLKTSAEVFDMNAENDIRGEEAHAKVSARYTFLKHLDLYGGVDNFLNEKARNTFVGLGVRFYDDDLKTLIISQGLGALAQ